MNVSEKIIKVLTSQKEVKKGLQLALGITNHNVMKYRIDNNTKLDTPQAIEYYKSLGYSIEEIFDLETTKECRRLTDKAMAGE